MKFYKILTTVVFAFLMFVAQPAWAMTPTLTLSASSDNTYVDLNVTGDAQKSVLLYYYSLNNSGPQIKFIGTTNSSGNYSTTLNVAEYNISPNSVLNVLVNNQNSTSVAWPSSLSTTANFSLSQTSVVASVGQSITVTANNTASKSVYLSTNSNPSIANISISGTQISVNGLSKGTTNASICLLNSTSACITLYAVVQDSSAVTLGFSQNNIMVVNGQNVQITVTGGNGFYQVVNNSNSTAIGTGLNGPTLTLYGNTSSGTSTIMICTTDMTGCGTVNASIGTYSSTGLSFSQNNPMVITSQTATVTMSGGYGNYYVSSNSNSTIVQTYISGNVLTLYGSLPGSATLQVCANSGGCGTVNVTVGGSTGGNITLNQTSANLQAGQVISLIISGGTMPYSIIQDNGGVAQYSLNGSSLTITGIKAGTSTASVCSASGGCVTPLVTVAGTTVLGTQLILGQNNLTLTIGQNSSVSLSGAGGYFVSNNSNQNVASASISGSNIVVQALTTGLAAITICQTGGQCSTLSVTVQNTTTTTTITNTPLTFSRDTLSILAGSNTSVTISGGAGTGYYVAYNLNPDAVGVNISGNTITLTGEKSGASVIAVCSSVTVCNSITATVTSATSSSNSTTVIKYKFTKPLKFGSSGTEVTKLQIRLKEDGYLTATATGYYGNQTVAAVKKYQKAHGLEQLGNVGPGTRASLNK